MGKVDQHGGGSTKMRDAFSFMMRNTSAGSARSRQTCVPAAAVTAMVTPAVAMKHRKRPEIRSRGQFDFDHSAQRV